MKAVAYFNGKEVLKIENFSNVCGVRVCSLENVKRLMDLEEGYYSIEGKEFKIEKPFKNLGEYGFDEKTLNKKQIVFPLRGGKSYIEKYLDLKGEIEYKNHMLMGLIEEKKPYEPDCSACGDGGCFHCEPHRFL